MKSIYGLVVLLMILLSVNLNAQDDIKSDEYWFVEDFSEDLLVAYHEHCQKHVYSRSGKKLLSINDAYTMLEKVEEAEDLYQTVRRGVTADRKFDPRQFESSELEQYWWYGNGTLHPIKTKNLKVVELADKTHYLFNQGTYIELRNEEMQAIFRFEGKRKDKTLSEYDSDWFDGENFSIKGSDNYFSVIHYQEYDPNNNYKIKVYDTKGEFVFEIWARDLFPITGGYWSVELEDEKRYLLDENHKVDKSTAYQTYDSKALCEDEEIHPILPYIDHEAELWQPTNGVNLNIEGTDSLLIGTTVPTDKSTYGYLNGIVNVKTRQEILPPIYYRMAIADSNLIVLLKDLKGEGKFEDRKYAIYQLSPNEATAITDFEFDMIDVLNPRIAVVKKEGKYYLYDIKKNKISKVAFNKVSCLDKIHVYLNRFGEWCLFNANTEEFEYELGEVDRPLDIYGCWLLENYDHDLWTTEHEDERYEHEEVSNRMVLYGKHQMPYLFRDSDFAHHVINPDKPVKLYASNNRKIEISVPFGERFHIYDNYLLYKNEKGFHLVDTTGKHLFRNKPWKEAGLLNDIILAEDESLYCLVETEKGAIAVFDAYKNKMIYDGLTTIRYLELPIGYGLMRGEEHKDLIVYDKERGKLNVLSNLYDEILDAKQDIDGNYIFLIRLGEERFWVDSQGHYKNACLNN